MTYPTILILFEEKSSIVYNGGDNFSNNFDLERFKILAKYDISIRSASAPLSQRPPEMKVFPKTVK